MLSFISNFTEGFGNIVSVVFFFFCIFLANLTLSQPILKNILKRRGKLISFAIVLVVGNLIYGAFSFLIFDSSFFLQSLFRSSFGITEFFQFLKDLVVIGVYGLGSYLIYTSHKKGAGPSIGKTTLLTMVVSLCLIILTACTSNHGDPWYEFREFLKTANWVVYEILSATIYIIAGFIAYKTVSSQLINDAIQKFSVITQVLLFCVFTDLLFGVLYHPVYNLFDFINGIAYQRNFMPIISNLIGTLLFIGGFVFVYQRITQDDLRQKDQIENIQSVPEE